MWRAELKAAAAAASTGFALGAPPVAPRGGPSGASAPPSPAAGAPSSPATLPALGAATPAQEAARGVWTRVAGLLEVEASELEAFYPRHAGGAGGATPSPRGSGSGGGGSGGGGGGGRRKGGSSSGSKAQGGGGDGGGGGGDPASVSAAITLSSYHALLRASLRCALERGTWRSHACWLCAGLSATLPEASDDDDGPSLPGTGRAEATSAKTGKGKAAAAAAGGTASGGGGCGQSSPGAEVKDWAGAAASDRAAVAMARSEIGGGGSLFDVHAVHPLLRPTAAAAVSKFQKSLEAAAAVGRGRARGAGGGGGEPPPPPPPPPIFVAPPLFGSEAALADHFRRAHGLEADLDLSSLGTSPQRWKWISDSMPYVASPHVLGDLLEVRGAFLSLAFPRYFFGRACSNILGRCCG